MATLAAGMEDAARQIRALDGLFMRYANEKNADGLMEFYADDAQLLPPGAPLVRGGPAIRDFWKAFLAAGASDAWIETGDITTSGDHAFGVGKYSVTMEGARQEGKYVVVYRRQAGTYKAVIDIFNANS